MDVHDIYSKEGYFKENTWGFLVQCLKSFENQEYLSTGIWAAILTESLVGDCLQKLGTDTTGMDLYNMIKGLKKVNYTNEDKNLFADITARADQLREKRNRIVHDTGVQNQLIEQDATTMYYEVIGIVGDYLKTTVAENIYKANMGSNDGPQASLEYSYKAFISTITPHSVEQMAFINGFCERLKEIGIKPVRCIFDNFGRKDPMGKVCGMIKECDAFITIGLERSHVYYFKDNEGTKDEEENTHRRYTSSWLQLESGMAIAFGKPIYVLCQDSLFGEGIFDPGWNTYNVQKLSLPLDIYDSSVELLLNSIKADIENAQHEHGQHDMSHSM